MKVIFFYLTALYILGFHRIKTVPASLEEAKAISNEDIVIFPNDKNEKIEQTNRFKPILNRVKFEEITTEKVIDVLVDSSEDTTYFEDVSFYPNISDLIKIKSKYSESDILKDLKYFADVATKPTNKNAFSVQSRRKNSDSGGEDLYMCEAFEELVFPKIAKNEDDKWLFVVNDEKFVQGVRVKRCVKKGKCRFSDNFPLGYKTECRQEYVQRRLVALSGEGDIVHDAFMLPSCCQCIIKRDRPSKRKFNPFL